MSFQRIIAGCLAVSSLVVTTPRADAVLMPVAPRQVISLNGTWEVAQGSMDSVPETFTRTITVPGLLDMAKPSFQEVGKVSSRREAFWYRRTFSVDGPIPEIALLKIHKARYTTRVFVNGRLAGDHLPCFTPAYLDVNHLLKGDGFPNEVVIRVGANRETVAAGQPSGWDFETFLYIPGIYDSVELILTHAPYVVNIQTVPDIVREAVDVVVEMQAGGQASGAAMTLSVSEAKSGKLINSKLLPPVDLQPGETKKVSVNIPMKDCRLWSPEDPFLYRLTLSMESDAVNVRFGMRNFRFDPKTGRAVLNGKPYFMRGTNATVHRFFEDELRGDLPWRPDWVRRLHQAYKTMHWNSIRYCIGFPPEAWYDIADEEGFLIQDEFPIWLLSGQGPEDPRADKIIPEYTAWMRERWNHPSVVIWDGQNESETDQTGIAIRAVRDLDLSNRPWENGFGGPQKEGDCVEAHPYMFIRTWRSEGKEPFYLREIADNPGLVRPPDKEGPAIVINEYDWLWIDRAGDPTCLTDRVYESLLGKESTAQQRRKLHARYVAALTEFWRGHRSAAGVLHFCGLTGSRPGDKPRPEGGATSDDFIDVENLVFEPYFAEYVGDAFNPQGLMLDFWAETLEAGSQRTFSVHVINDLDSDWESEVRLYLIRNGDSSALTKKEFAVEPLGKTVLSLEATLPADTGSCTLVAELTDRDGKRVRSLRDVTLEGAR
jgi:hypothetical protein